MWQELAKNLELARGVIFDFRIPNRLSAKYAKDLNRTFERHAISQRLHHGDMMALPKETMLWRGFPNGYNGYTYYKGIFSDSLEKKLINNGKKTIPVSFVCDVNSLIPDIALSLVNAGSAMIYSADKTCERGSAEVDIVKIDKHWVYETRRSSPKLTNMRTPYCVLAAPSADLDDALYSASIKWIESKESPQCASQLAYLPPSIMNPLSPNKNDFINKEERIAAVIEFWSVVKYFHPDYYKFAEDWALLLGDSIILASNATDAVSFARVIQGMVGHIPDGHVFVHSKDLRHFFGEGLLPLEIRVISGRAVVTGVQKDNARGYNKIGLGDEIISVGGVPVLSYLRTERSFVSSSTEQDAIAKLLNRLITGKVGTTVAIDFRDKDNVKKTVDMMYVNEPGNFVNVSPAQKYNGLPTGIQYINLLKIARDGVEPFFEGLDRVKILILDLRGYPDEGGVAWHVASRMGILNNRPFAIINKPSVGGPLAGNAVMSDIQHVRQVLPQSDYSRYLGKIIVLIDERAISQSEHIAMILRANAHATFVGVRTAGVDGDVTSYCARRGFCISFSGASVSWPDGRPVSGFGIDPDISVVETIEGIRNGHDEIFERAFKFAMGNHSPSDSDPDAEAY